MLRTEYYMHTLVHRWLHTPYILRTEYILDHAAWTSQEAGRPISTMY